MLGDHGSNKTIWSGIVFLEAFADILGGAEPDSQFL